MFKNGWGSCKMHSQISNAENTSPGYWGCAQNVSLFSCSKSTQFHIYLDCLLLFATVCFLLIYSDTAGFWQTHTTFITWGTLVMCWKRKIRSNCWILFCDLLSRLHSLGLPSKSSSKHLFTSFHWFIHNFCLEYGSTYFLQANSCSRAVHRTLW